MLCFVCVFAAGWLQCVVCCVCVYSSLFWCLLVVGYRLLVVCCVLLVVVCCSLLFVVVLVFVGCLRVGCWLVVVAN